MKQSSCVMTLALAIWLAGCSTVAPENWNKLTGLFGGELSTSTIVAGLKEALRVGTERATDQLSAPGGYATNAAVKLLLPEQLDTAAKTLKRLGLGAYIDQFEAKMNEAAEKAAAQAVPVFVDAVKSMTIADAKAILHGGDTAATDYFRRQTQDRLRTMYTPIVRRTMDEVGTASTYNTLIDKYNAIPLATKPDFSLDAYVTEKALDGLFLKVGEMEQQIRADPAARTTELLRRVFGKP